MEPRSTLQPFKEEFINYKEFEDSLKNVNSTFQNILVKVIGKTTQNRNIYLIIASKNIKQEFQFAKERFSIFICARQHGDEPASTKALIEYLPKLNSSHFLRNITVLMIPWVNPDGGEFFEKYNALGIDINDDHLALRSSEAKSMHLVYNCWNPSIFIDLHETGAIKENLAYLWPFNEFVSPIIMSASKSLVENMTRYINDKGFMTATWRGISDLITTARNYFALRGSLSVLIETNLKDKLDERVGIQILCVDLILEYTAKNLEYIKHTVRSSKEAYKEFLTKNSEEKKIWGFVFYSKDLEDVSFLKLHGIEIYRTSKKFVSTALSYKRVDNKFLMREDRLIFYPPVLIIPCKGFNVPIALIIFNNWKESLNSSRSSLLSKDAEFYVLCSSPRIEFYKLDSEKEIKLKKPVPSSFIILAIFFITLSIAIFISYISIKKVRAG
ncbi:MAG: M14 family zinc carboxypeptidase [Candidatus Bathyarchaeia archaeon]